MLDRHAPLMGRHGRRESLLPPNAILWLAKMDLAKRSRNRARAAAGMAEDADSYEEYAFMGNHVRRSKTPADLIMDAIEWRKAYDKWFATMDPGDAASYENKFMNAKLSTLRLTASMENLRLAHDLALAEVAPVDPPSVHA